MQPQSIILERMQSAAYELAFVKITVLRNGEKFGAVYSPEDEETAPNTVYHT